MGTSGTGGNTGPPCFQDFASPCDLLTDHTPSHTSMMGSSGTGGNTAPPCSQDFASPCDFSTDHTPSHNHVTQPDKQGFIIRNWQQSRCPIFYPSRHAFPITPPSTPSVILQFLLNHPSIFTRPSMSDGGTGGNGTGAATFLTFDFWSSFKIQGLPPRVTRADPPHNPPYIFCTK